MSTPQADIIISLRKQLAEAKTAEIELKAQLERALLRWEVSEREFVTKREKDMVDERDEARKYALELIEVLRGGTKRGGIFWRENATENEDAPSWIKESGK